LINFHTSKRTTLFNDKLLSQYEEIKGKNILGVMTHRASGYLFALLQDQMTSQTKLYIIDVEQDKLVQTLTIPAQVETFIMQTYQNKVFLSYSGDEGVCVDYTQYNAEDLRTPFSYSLK
jgi:hypothetical protein